MFNFFKNYAETLSSDYFSAISNVREMSSKDKIEHFPNLYAACFVACSSCFKMLLKQHSISTVFEKKWFDFLVN